MNKDAQIRRDMRIALASARRAGVPLAISSAAMGGGAPHLALVRRLLHGIAREEGLRFRSTASAPSR